MKIINRYVLKEHIGPFVFALSALTSLLLLQVIARRFGDLVGKGLSWGVITEFFLLSIPYTLAMTLPMAMLVAVLYAFSRLASENEITALKAGGVSTRALMVPAVMLATGLALFMLWFNDQILPRANHELATLQVAILRTKPTFALRPQVINTIKESQLYLSAAQIDEGTGLMKNVTIYDVSDGNRRKTIYADSGKLALTPNMRDLSMHLYKGMMLMSPTNQPEQVNRIYYREDMLKVRDVANQFQSINADTASKGDREMSICEMQKQYEAANLLVLRARNDSLDAVWRLKEGKGDRTPQPQHEPATKAGGIGAIYCTVITKYLKVKEASAEELPRPRQDTSGRKAVVPRVPPQQPNSLTVLVNGKAMRVPSDRIPPNAYFMGGVPAGTQAIRDAFVAESIKAAARLNAPPPAPVSVPPATGTGQPVGGQPVGVQPVPGAVVPGAVVPATANPPAGAVGAAAPGTATPNAPNQGTTLSISTAMELTDAHLRLEDARYRRNRAGVEIQKKFSLAFACIVFVLVGAPLAVRFPRGGVGLVIGASFLIFAIYYVGLIGGESLANKNIISPFWAMWADNILFLLAGIALMIRMGRESGSGRGGGFGEMFDAIRLRFARGRGAPTTLNAPAEP